MTEPDIVTRLRDFAAMDDWPFIAEAADEIERLRAERDEARREVCVAEAMLSPRDDKTPRMEAAERGWDCFKENTDAR